MSKACGCEGQRWAVGRELQSLQCTAFPIVSVRIDTEAAEYLCRCGRVFMPIRPCIYTDTAGAVEYELLRTDCSDRYSLYFVTDKN
jgi:hypothetical protein